MTIFIKAKQLVLDLNLLAYSLSSLFSKRKFIKVVGVCELYEK